MGSEWPTCSLKEAGVQLIDCDHKTPKAQESGFPYIGIPQMKEGNIDFDANPRLISQSDLVTWTKRAKPQTNDVILSRRCNSGETVHVASRTEFALGQNLVILRSVGERVFPPYLRWVVRSPQWWAEVGKYLNPGAIFESLKCADIPKFEIPIPPLPEQKTIAHILGTLDDKIELNRRMNATLEGMAQALFKSWLVDFDPVIDNALAAGNPIPDELAPRAEVRKKALASSGEPRRTNATTQQGSLDHPTLSDPKSLFPATFQETTSMGWIPEGWKITRLEDLCETITKGTTPRKSDVEAATDEPSVRFLKVKDINEDFSIDLSSLTRNPASVHTGVLKRSIIKAHDLVFSIAGTIGRIAVICQSLHDSNCNQAVGIIRLENADDHLALALFSLASKRVQDDIHSKVTQGVQANASLTNLRDIEILIPSDVVKDRWGANQVNSLLERIRANQTQSTSLSRMRDTLLPRLISGELQIVDTETLAEEVLA